jgi:putative pyrroloquinoline-quinone binding quinoprotein
MCETPATPTSAARRCSSARPAVPRPSPSCTSPAPCSSTTATTSRADRTRLAAYGTYAYSRAERTLFVANNTTGDFEHGVLGFRVADDCALVPAWHALLGPEPAILAPPVVANGVVYAGTGFGREVYALNSQTGEPLWVSPRLEGAVYGAPTVVDGRLYVGAWDEHLHAFAPSPG